MGHYHNNSTRMETKVLTSSCIYRNMDELCRRYRTSRVVLVKPLLILDVNGLLCLRVKENAPRGCEYKEAIGNVACTEIIPRPDLLPLLYFLDEHFTLAVWTSAKLKNANKLIDLLFPFDIKTRLLFIWGQNSCDEKNPANSESWKDVIFIKSIN